MPVAEANTIIARWRADSYLAFLEIDFNREPSSGESSRTNTSGGRIATSTVVMVPNSLRTASSGQTFMADPLVRIAARHPGRSPSAISAGRLAPRRHGGL